MVHLDASAMRSLEERIGKDHGQLDVLVNDIFGGDRYAEWDKPLWEREHDLAGGLQMLRMGVETHIVTSAIALPLVLQTGSGLLVEMTDGTRGVNTAGTCHEASFSGRSGCVIPPPAGLRERPRTRCVNVPRVVALGCSGCLLSWTTSTFRSRATPPHQTEQRHE